VALILDTNAFSALADGDEKLLRAIDGEPELALPAIVLGEYMYGIQQSRLRTSYEAWMMTSLPSFDILPVVRETASRYCQVRLELKASGQPIPTNDLWIAALARQHKARLVTRDTHFRVVRGLQIVTW
jgi:tRNA(fMet)-specific endonuclease VapC